MSLPSINLAEYPEHKRGPWMRGEGNGGCWLCGFAHIGKNPSKILVEAGTFIVLDPSTVNKNELENSVFTQFIGSTCLKKHPELKPYVYNGE